MKTFKSFFVALALVGALMLPSSCKKNNASKPEEQKQQEVDTTPTQVILSFVFYHTEDMLKYFNIQLILENGEDAAKTITVTKDLLDDQLRSKDLVAADHLPATLTVTRKITLKQDISSAGDVQYTKGHSYQYALYNKDGDRVYLSDMILINGLSSLDGAALTPIIEKGGLDQSYTFKFDEKGKLVK